MKPIAKILVPVDYTEQSAEALAYAVQLAKGFGASVTILHAWELPPHTGPEVLIHGQDDKGQSLPDYIQSRAKQALVDFAQQYKDSGITVEGQLAQGSPAKVINHIASVENFDMIVMATHGRTGVSRLFLGSVAEEVVRHASCPVVTLRPEAIEKEEELKPEPPRAPGEKAPPYMPPHVYRYSDGIAPVRDQWRGALW